MTIWEISEKADYIAGRHHRLQDAWRNYCNALVQGITLSRARLHHAIGCAPEQQLSFVLFEHFTVYITLSGGFNGHTIEYAIANKDSDDKHVIGEAWLTSDGKVDGVFSAQDREKVLEHYLDKIATVYTTLYVAMEADTPVNLATLALA
ncbi:formate hydrogenlyase regulator HycA [Kosakonia sp. H02]|nr:formate hydrogenlyase regulator HycA [Kosakonia sp. H02]